MIINVTKTFLPPQEEYQAILKKAWDTGWMTNRGLLVKELEDKLKSHLGVDNILAMTNGTLPLQIAIKALGLTGEIITTPFSYVATTSSIIWEGCVPVFVDIHPDYLTIDETKIEAAITDNTSAILATHVFGNPCDVEAIQSIADKHGLKVIYDAAHCFGVRYKGHSVFNYGDVSTCSFHATKVFHTGEGGALFCKPEHRDAMFYFHNFGHSGKEEFATLGINAKMSEPQAALGLAVLNHMDGILNGRKKAVQYYDKHLHDLKAFSLREDTSWNFAYYPILFDSEEKLLKTVKKLNDLKIYPRRYFYPSLNRLPYVVHVEMPISQDISRRILCLPLSHEITQTQQDIIIKALNHD